MNYTVALHRFSDLLAGDIPFDWRRDWLALVVAFYGSILLGPVLLLAFKLQRWNVRCPWDSEDHWSGTRQFAVTFLIWDSLLLLAWFHFQAQVALLSSTNIGWWLLFHPLLWYAVLILLTPTLALLLERLDPRTVSLERVLLPTEQVLPPSAPERPVGKQTAVTGSEQGTNAPRKRRKGRAVPLGQLLLEEREAQRLQAKQIRFIQPPSDHSEMTAPSEPSSQPIPKMPSPSKSKRANEGQRHHPESLDQLF